MQTVKNSNHWSNYWQGGQLTSLPQDFKFNYDGIIQQEWHKCFAKLKNKSTIVDLCTGNCAIALLASQYSFEHCKDFCLTAVDAANITKEVILKAHPQQKKYLDKIKLLANSPIENLNLSHQHYDLITSQYGIEYSNWQQTAKKVAQLLKNNGTFMMLCHSSHSQIIKTMQIEQKDYLFAINHGLFRLFDVFSQAKLSFRNFNKRLKRIQNQLNSRFNQNPTELIRSLLILNDKIATLSKKDIYQNLASIKIISQQHKNAYQRLADLLTVCTKLNQNPQWYEVFIEAGLTLVEQKPVYYHKQIHCGDLYKFTQTQ